MHTSINQRIGKIIKHENISLTAFSRQIGVAQTSLRDIVKGGAEPKFSTLERIIKAKPTISTDWLLLGEGEMLKSNSAVRSELDIIDYKEKFYKALEEKDSMYKQLVKALQKVLLLNEKIQLLNDELGEVKNDIVKQASAVMDVLSEKSAS